MRVATAYLLSVTDAFDNSNGTCSRCIFAMRGLCVALLRAFALLRAAARLMVEFSGGGLYAAVHIVE